MKQLKKGISFLEAMISIMLLAMAALYLVPVFITSSRSSVMQQRKLQAAFFASGLAERIKEAAKIYIAGPGGVNDPFTNLENIYSADTQANFSSFFLANGFTADSSIIALAETDPNNPIGPDTITTSKQLHINLNWLEEKNGTSQELSYALVTQVAAPSGMFDVNALVETSNSTVPPPPTTTTSFVTTTTVPPTTTTNTTTIATTSTSTVAPTTTTSETTTSVSTTTSSQNGTQ